VGGAGGNARANGTKNAWNPFARSTLTSSLSCTFLCLDAVDVETFLDGFGRPLSVLGVCGKDEEDGDETYDAEWEWVRGGALMSCDWVGWARCGCGWKSGVEGQVYDRWGCGCACGCEWKNEVVMVGFGLTGDWR